MKLKIPFLALLCLSMAPRLCFGSEGAGVLVPADVSNEAWNRMLKKYVNDRGLVAYADWKKNQTDIEAFGSKRYGIGGRKASLDDIEHNTLRPLLGYRTHAVLVCAARSCPPLQRFAYTGSQLDRQIDTPYRAWFAREDLNRFLPEQRKVQISNIFNWYKGDFDKAGGMGKILVKYAPQQYRDFLTTADYKISYLPYNWGLNDQGSHGNDYSRSKMIWDFIRNSL